MTHYKNLEAWKKSMQLVKEIYLLAKSFPKEELFSLTAQIKRSAVSVPSNIAEGCGRKYKKETVQFLHIARGSLYELETQLNIAMMIEVMREDQLNQFNQKTDECLKIVNGLISYYERSDLK